MIEVTGLGITLGEFTLRDINLKVEEAEYFVILGPTGAGKTVLVECIVGLHRPSHGSVFLDGKDVSHLKPEERRVAYVPQDYCLFPHMNVRQNIEFGMRRQRMPEREIKESTERLAGMMHITSLLSRHPLTLSGGEKQRAALCRALAVKPRVLLLDEPLAAVDERTRETMCQELKTVQRELGTTTIHVSHNFEETLAVADKIGVFNEGRIVQSGTPFEIFRRPTSEFVASFTGCENVFTCRLSQGRCDILGMPDGASLRVDFTAAGEARAMVRPEDLRIHADSDRSVENAFGGVVTRLLDKGPLFKVFVQTGDLEWSVLVSRRECGDLGIRQGSRVIVEVPEENVHIIGATGE